MEKSKWLITLLVALVLMGVGMAGASGPKRKEPKDVSKSMGSDVVFSENGERSRSSQMRKVTIAQREEARARQARPDGVSELFAGLDGSKSMSPLAPAPEPKADKGSKTHGPLAGFQALAPLAAMGIPNGTPDYFGIPNWASSPLPTIDPTTGALTGGIRKFVDSLPGLGPAGANNLGQFIPIATPDVGTFPGSDFYRIGLTEYSQQMHSDLPPTKLRGYVQLDSSNKPLGSNHYLGPLILAKRNRPVRVLFDNLLPPNSKLFIPVDTSYMGAGLVSDGVNSGMASENRSVIHLHGGNSPWISDGTPHQWVTPVGETVPNVAGFAKGMSFENVPDMVGQGKPILNPTLTDGLGTYFWTNDQSERLLFYHEHAYGITRLHAYAGVAAGYMILDPVQEDALFGATVPGTLGTLAGGGTQADLGHFIPLVIQDKTFVPDDGAPGGQLAATDPTWDVATYGGKGSLWFPHVYMPNQNPYDLSGANPFGRWDYGPWFWPPQDPGSFVPEGLPVDCTSTAYPGKPLVCPGTPNPSGTPEGFMDTPLVNGAAYPYINLKPAAYRFEVLSAGNDRALNLGLYYAATAPPLVTLTGGGGTGATASALVAGGVKDVTITNAGTGYTSPPTVDFVLGGGAGATATASISGVLDSIPVHKGGSGYSAPPTVTLVGGGGTGAAATATILGGVNSIAINDRGSGYTSTPTVTITGDGSGAEATVLVTGALDTITVKNPGSGYTTAPVVSLTNAAGDTGTGAAATAVLSAAIDKIDVTAGGSGYSTPPAVTLTGDGTGAAATASIRGPLAGVTLTNPGSGYTSVPTIIFTNAPGDTGSGAAASTTLVGSVTGVTVNNGGSGYSTPPTVNFTGDGTGATGTAAISGNVSAITLTSGGTGYSTAPSVTLTGGGGTGAKATATITGSVSAVTVTSTGKGYAVTPTVSFGGGGGGTGAAATATMSSYVNTITVTNKGAGYTTAPSVNITGGGGTGATAVANIANGVVTGITVTNPGSGYSGIPLVTITGRGGARAVATLAKGVTGITLTNAGSGYTSPPTVTLSGGGATTQATATAALNGSVTAISLTNNGSGYTTPPTVSLTGKGTGASATATLNCTVTGITVTNAGSGYSSTPSVTLTGGGGSGASATATLLLDHIGSISLDNPGSGYSQPPIISFTGGGAGSGAAATATINGSVTGITVTAGGTGYSSPPTVTLAGNGTGAAATASLLGGVGSVTITSRGTQYSAPPTVDFVGGGGSGAVATATTSFGISSISVTRGGSGYTTAPTVSLTGGGGSGATATATLAASVQSITVTNPGTGYSSAPAVTFTGDGTGAAATATIKGSVTGIMVTHSGNGYTSPPTVVFTGGGGGGAAATAHITHLISGIVVTNGGQNYTSPPNVNIMGGGGMGATAAATISKGAVVGIQVTNGGSNFYLPGTPCKGGLVTDLTLCTEVAMLPALPPEPSWLEQPCTEPTQVSGCGLAMGAEDPATGDPLYGTGLPLNPDPVTGVPAVPCWPSTWPIDGRDGGVPDPATAGPAIVQIAAEGGLLPNPVLIPSTPVSYEYDRRSITVLNISTHGLLVGPAERASILIDFSTVPSNSILILYNDAPAPVPASDPRVDYYTGGPDLTSVGGAPSTQPGYGPNTRTIMQFRIAGTGDNATRFSLSTLKSALPGIFGATQHQIIVPETVYNAALGTSYSDTYARIQDTALTLGPSPLSGLALTNGGSGYTSAPTVKFVGGGGTGAAATATLAGAPVMSLALTTGGSGYTAAPSVTISGGGGTGATATAMIRNGTVASVTLTNAGTGYTSSPTVSFSPPPRGVRAAGAATIRGSAVTSITLTNSGTGYTSPPSVFLVGGGGRGAAARSQVTNTLPMFPKCIQELFTLDYGRMNATLGVELPFTTFLVQTTIPYGYIDPPTELVKDGDTQIWKLTHNGVDTHFIHFHLFDVQVINRIGWDGVIKPPDANEVGWKDTVRMNPLEDIVIAMRVMKQNLPWPVPNSIRPLDVTKPIGTSMPFQFTNVDPNNMPATVTNDLMNFGCEYVWHCHILGHEENDMMRAMCKTIPPAAPSGLNTAKTVTGGSPSVTLTFKDNSTNETGFTVQRSNSQNGPWISVGVAPSGTGTGSTVSFVDTGVVSGTVYYYKVFASNVVGYTQAYSAGIGYPTLDAPSAAVSSGAVIP